MEIGKKIWAIAEGYIPGWSNGPGPELTSHEAACILNAGDEDAHIDLMIYFADRKPAGPFKLIVKSQRTHHFRFNDLRIQKRFLWPLLIQVCLYPVFRLSSNIQGSIPDKMLTH